MTLYHINPVPKPRQTRSDKWKKRDCVMRYRSFADEVRAAKIKLLPGATICFYIKMPNSWKPEKKKKMDGGPHMQRPDLSNLLKALEDAVYGEDSHLWWYGRIRKIWGYAGAIQVINQRATVEAGP